MTRSCKRLHLLALLILGLAPPVYGQTYAPSWIDNLKEGKLDLGGSYEQAMPAGFELDYQRSSGGRTDYRQTWEGVPIYGTRVSDIHDELGHRVSVWTYSGHLAYDMAWNWFVPTVPEAWATEIARKKTESNAPLTAELMILPLRLPKLVWVITEERASGLAPYWEFVMDAKNHRVWVKLDNKLEPPVEPAPTTGTFGGSNVPTYVLPCPPVSPNHYAFGQGYLHQHCLPAEEIVFDPFRRWRMRGTTQSVFPIAAYEYPPGASPTLADLSSPEESWIPLTDVAPLGPFVTGNDFRDDHLSAVSAYAMLNAVTDYWHSASAYGTPLYPDTTRGVQIIAEAPTTLVIGQDREGRNFRLLGNALYQPDGDYFLVSESPSSGFDVPFAAALDVMGHEFAHAITFKGNDVLPRSFEGRALNEGFADVLGTLAASGIKQEPVNWLMGTGLGGTFSALRNLANPRDPEVRSIGLDHFSELDRTAEDYHSAGSILGLAFSLMDSGGRPPFTPGHDHPGPTVSPQPIDKVGRLAFKIATERLTLAPSFGSIRRSAVELAENHFLDPGLANTVRDAFRAVGVVNEIPLTNDPSQPFPVLDIPQGQRRYLSIRGSGGFDWTNQAMALRFEGMDGDDFTISVKQGGLPWQDEDASLFTGSLGTGQVEIAIRPTAGDANIPMFVEITALTDLEALHVVPSLVPLQKVEPPGILDFGFRGIRPIFILLTIPDDPNRAGSPGPWVIQTRSGLGGQAIGNTVLKLWKGLPGDALQAPLIDDQPGLAHELVTDSLAPGEYWIEIEVLSEHGDFALSVTKGHPQSPTAHRNGCTATACQPYAIGDTVSLAIVTNPPLANQPIWMWRYKNGQVERTAHQLLTRDAAGQITEVRTDNNGVYTSPEVVLENPAACGIYANEEFAVGSPHLLRSARRSFRIGCVGKTQPGGPVATRPDGQFPHYELGDYATLEIVTDPPVPNAPVYTWRSRDGVVERDGEPLYLQDPRGFSTPATTDSQGRLIYTGLLDDAGACGTFTKERFAVGSPSGLRSGALAYMVYCPDTQPPHAERPDAAFPNYQVGNFAALRIATNPPQPNQRIYGWRMKDGESERFAKPMMHDDGNGSLVPWRTDASGVFEIADVQLVGEDVCGSYSSEQFTVGDVNGPKSPPLAFNVQCPLPPNAPNVSRPDGNYPAYHLNDRAALTITTWPPQPFQQVYGWRSKDGLVERDGVPIYYQENGVGIPMITDASGRFQIQDVLLEDPTVCGVYSGEQFAVGSTSNPRSTPVSFTVSCTNAPSFE